MSSKQLLCPINKPKEHLFSIFINNSLKMNKKLTARVFCFYLY